MIVSTCILAAANADPNLVRLADSLPEPVSRVLALGIAALVAAAAVAVLLGVLLLFWGRVFHRALLGLVAGAVGLLLGTYYGPQIQLNVLAAQAAGALTFALLGVVLARLLWSVLAGLHVAVLAAALMLVFYVGESLAATQPGVFSAANEATARIDEALRQDGPVLWAAVIGSGLAATVVAFLLPRTTVILMTALVGAELLSSAIGMGLAYVSAGPAGTADRSQNLAGAIGLGLFAVGAVFQAVCEVRARRAASGDEGKAGKNAPSDAGDQ